MKLTNRFYSNTLNQLRDCEYELMTDLTIVCSNGLVESHQALFAWMSSSLRRLFVSKLVMEDCGKRKDFITLHLPDVKTDILTNIIKIFSCGQIAISSDKLHRISEAWSLIQIDKLYFEELEIVCQTIVNNVPCVNERVDTLQSEVGIVIPDNVSVDTVVREPPSPEILDVSMIDIHLVDNEGDLRTNSPDNNIIEASNHDKINEEHPKQVEEKERKDEKSNDKTKTATLRCIDDDDIESLICDKAEESKPSVSTNAVQEKAVVKKKQLGRRSKPSNEEYRSFVTNANNDCSENLSELNANNETSQLEMIQEKSKDDEIVDKDVLEQSNTIEIVDDDDENSNLDDKNPKEVSVEKMVDNVKKPRGRPKKLLNRNKGIRTQTNGDGNSSQEVAPMEKETIDEPLSSAISNDITSLKLSPVVELKKLPFSPRNQDNEVSAEERIVSKTNVEVTNDAPNKTTNDLPFLTPRPKHVSVPSTPRSRFEAEPTTSNLLASISAILEDNPVPPSTPTTNKLMQSNDLIPNTEAPFITPRTQRNVGTSQSSSFPIQSPRNSGTKLTTLHVTSEKPVTPSSKHSEVSKHSSKNSIQSPKILEAKTTLNGTVPNSPRHPSPSSKMLIRSSTMQETKPTQKMQETKSTPIGPKTYLRKAATPVSKANLVSNPQLRQILPKMTPNITELQPKPQPEPRNRPLLPKLNSNNFIEPQGTVINNAHLSLIKRIDNGIVNNNSAKPKDSFATKVTKNPSNDAIDKLAQLASFSIKVRKDYKIVISDESVSKQLSVEKENSIEDNSIVSSTTNIVDEQISTPVSTDDDIILIDDDEEEPTTSSLATTTTNLVNAPKEIVLPGYEGIEVKNDVDDGQTFSLAASEVRNLLESDDEEDIDDPKDPDYVESNATKKRKLDEKSDSSIIKRSKEDTNTEGNRVENLMEIQNNPSSILALRKMSDLLQPSTSSVQTAVSTHPQKVSQNNSVNEPGKISILRKHACLLCFGNGKEGPFLSFKELSKFKEHYSQCFYDEGVYPRFISPGQGNTADDGSVIDETGATNGASYRCRVIDCWLQKKTGDAALKGYKDYAIHMATDHGVLEQIIAQDGRQQLKEILECLKKVNKFHPGVKECRFKECGTVQYSMDNSRELKLHYTNKHLKDYFPVDKATGLSPGFTKSGTRAVCHDCSETNQNRSVFLKQEQDAIVAHLVVKHDALREILNKVTNFDNDKLENIKQDLYGNNQ